ncbi:MAG TPA: hypothetical protein VJU84_19550 [Pyrinomonadaceae bacterium]|nr:hypothetical protein [Pyrinomonadaceae bacterium]
MNSDFAAGAIGITTALSLKLARALGWIVLAATGGAITCAFLFSIVSLLRFPDEGESEWVLAGAVVGGFFGLAGGALLGVILVVATHIYRRANSINVSKGFTLKVDD